MNGPNLPDVARSLLKGLIMSLARSGVITGADAEQLLTALKLTDA